MPRPSHRHPRLAAAVGRLRPRKATLTVWRVTFAARNALDHRGSRLLDLTGPLPHTLQAYMRRALKDTVWGPNRGAVVGGVAYQVGGGHAAREEDKLTRIGGLAVQNAGARPWLRSVPSDGIASFWPAAEPRRTRRRPPL